MSAASYAWNDLGRQSTIGALFVHIGNRDESRNILAARQSRAPRDITYCDRQEHSAATFPP